MNLCMFYCPPIKEIYIFKGYYVNWWKRRSKGDRHLWLTNFWSPLALPICKICKNAVVTRQGAWFIPKHKYNANYKKNLFVISLIILALIRPTFAGSGSFFSFSFFSSRSRDSFSRESRSLSLPRRRSRSSRSRSRSRCLRSRSCKKKNGAGFWIKLFSTS